jgi:hypothetical protein
MWGGDWTSSLQSSNTSEKKPFLTAHSLQTSHGFGNASSSGSGFSSGGIGHDGSRPSSTFSTNNSTPQASTLSYSLFQVSYCIICCFNAFV